MKMIENREGLTLPFEGKGSSPGSLRGASLGSGVYELRTARTPRNLIGCLCSIVTNLSLLILHNQIYIFIEKLSIFWQL
jgi:hypothetical protein